jgi:hypothetical protein
MRPARPPKGGRSRRRGLPLEQVRARQEECRDKRGHVARNTDASRNRLGSPEASFGNDEHSSFAIRGDPNALHELLRDLLLNARIPEQHQSMTSFLASVRSILFLALSCPLTRPVRSQHEQGYVFYACRGRSEILGEAALSVAGLPERELGAFR